MAGLLPPSLSAWCKWFLGWVAAEEIGNPEMFWQLLDSNGALWAEELEADGAEIRITLPFPCPWHSLPFVLYYPHQERWLRNGRQDFRIGKPTRQERQAAVADGFN